MDNFEQFVITELGKQTTMLTEVKVQNTEALVKIDALAGPQGRVTKIEKQMSWNEKKQWIHTSAIVPLTLFLSWLQRRFGGYIG